MTRRQRRIYFVIFVLACLGFAVGLSLYALRDNVSFFYAPAEVKELAASKSARVAVGKPFRIGGMVKEGSLRKSTGNVRVDFIVTDYQEELRVVYRGILPDLFREGQGVVAKGSLDDKGVFRATELLAKHDENYMPPEVAKALKKKPEEK